MKYSKIGASLAWSGGTALLREGQSIEDDHPLVAERPELFSDVAPGASLTTPHNPTVERATAAPGEVRATPGKGPGTIRVPRAGQ